jgi:lipid-binding SYLF domain-containing protein
VCRTATGRWTGPSVIRVEGGSIGFQIGVGETDLVFLVMNHHGEDELLGDRFTVGGDASAMGGPVGRTAEAQTDALMRAEILSWSLATACSRESRCKAPPSGPTTTTTGGCMVNM